MTDEAEAIEFHLAWPPHPQSNGAVVSNHTIIAYGGAHRRKPQARFTAPHVSMTRIVYIKEARPEDTSVDVTLEYIAQLQKIIAETLPVEKPQGIGPQGCLVVVQFCLPPPPGDDWRVIAVIPSECQSGVPLDKLYGLIDRGSVPGNGEYGGEEEMQVYFECWGFKLTEAL
jgi:hypothetical protein